MPTSYSHAHMRACACARTCTRMCRVTHYCLRRYGCRAPWVATGVLLVAYCLLASVRIVWQTIYPQDKAWTGLWGRSVHQQVGRCCSRCSMWGSSTSAGIYIEGLSLGAAGWLARTGPLCKLLNVPCCCAPVLPAACSGRWCPAGGGTVRAPSSGRGRCRHGRGPGPPSR